MRTTLRAAGAGLLLLLITAVTGPAAALSIDGETIESGAADEEFTVGLTDFSMRIPDSDLTTSVATQNAVAAAYEEAEFQCSLRQAANEEGELLNEETELCEEEEGDLSTAELVALVSSEFRTLPLTAPAITYQPEGDWALVNMDFIVYTDADQQLLSTTILGVPVTVRATPVHYSWDFGDGSAPLSTTDAGRPYPDHTLAHVYTSAAESVQVSLTTSWQGELQINGAGPWLPIAGFATTTSSAPAVEIVAMDVNLVP
ncbi:hypothetical protein [Pseudactinotalea terrae]|uniref:hypothetical protein n=1 Tax=Pseudactinotalea terrae TaxID=1743262 RepID=UPI0012E3288F|nr:hypothetical protein [Pseudactinotalea terrae]